MADPYTHEPAAGLLDRAAAGDEAAFAELYRVYATPVFTVAVRMLVQREAAEDVLQEVFVELLRALPGYRRDGPFWAWLRRLAVSKVLMRMRAERARPALVSWHAADGRVGEWPDEAAGAAVDRMIAGGDLAAALAALPAVSRAVVWLHDVEGWTHREIGAAMGRTASFSKSQLARAHERLRALLEPREVTDDAPDYRPASRPA